LEDAVPLLHIPLLLRAGASAEVLRGVGLGEAGLGEALAAFFLLLLLLPVLLLLSPLVCGPSCSEVFRGVLLAVADSDLLPLPPPPAAAAAVAALEAGAAPPPLVLFILVRLLLPVLLLLIAGCSAVLSGVLAVDFPTAFDAPTAPARVLFKLLLLLLLLMMLILLFKLLTGCCSTVFRGALNPEVLLWMLLLLALLISCCSVFVVSNPASNPEPLLHTLLPLISKGSAAVFKGAE
jgi:hypothetical protein